MSLIDEIKSIASTIQKIDNIELYRKVLNVQQEALEAVEENDKLRKENTELKEKFKNRENLIYKNEAYWMVVNDVKDGPFCSRCWDKEQDLIRLHPMGNPSHYDCPNCKCGSVNAKPELDRLARASRPRQTYL